MAISKYKIKKWFKMIKGNSILHVNQGIGKYYERKNIKGYYNDLTEKITKDNLTREGELPKYPGEDGVNKIFPIGVFQYGLGAYDLYLATKEKKYLEPCSVCSPKLPNTDWVAKYRDHKTFFRKYIFSLGD